MTDVPASPRTLPRAVAIASIALATVLVLVPLPGDAAIGALALLVLA